MINFNDLKQCRPYSPSRSTACSVKCVRIRTSSYAIAKQCQSTCTFARIRGFPNGMMPVWKIRLYCSTWKLCSNRLVKKSSMPVLWVLENQAVTHNEIHFQKRLDPATSIWHFCSSLHTVWRCSWLWKRAKAFQVSQIQVSKVSKPRPNIRCNVSINFVIQWHVNNSCFERNQSNNQW